MLLFSSVLCVKVFKFITRLSPLLHFLCVYGNKFSDFFKKKKKDTYFLILYFSVAYCSANFPDGTNTRIYLNHVPSKYKMFHEEFLRPKICHEQFLIRL